MNLTWKIAHRLYTHSGGGFLKSVARIFELISYLIHSNNFSAQADVGNGTRIWHRGVGCVVHLHAKIGDNCNIFQNVTIGARFKNGKADSLAPTIGNNVMIGAGAVIIGGIKIGNNVNIGANSVVISDVPDNCTAVGVPARIINNHRNEARE